MFVLDASVAVSWCITDEDERYAESVLEDLHGSTAIVPAIWPLEVGNGLVIAERRDRLIEDGLSQSLHFLSRLPVVCEQYEPSHHFTQTVPLARAHSLSVYDASYLELAMRKGLPLATMDAALAKAAKKCGVAKYRPGAKRA